MVELLTKSLTSKVPYPKYPYLKHSKMQLNGLEFANHFKLSGIAEIG